jgi:hypothetical protein
MSKMLAKKWVDFIENHDPNQVSRNLRDILLDSIAHWHGQGLSIDFNERLMRIQALLELLDSASDQKKLLNKRGLDGSKGNYEQTILTN